MKVKIIYWITCLAILVLGIVTLARSHVIGAIIIAVAVIAAVMVQRSNLQLPLK